MELGKLKQYIESFEDNHVFDYSLSEPFSWRGSYSEVAFSIKDIECTKEQLLKNINLAYTKEFRGYKGGEFTFNDYTDINFEYDYSSYSDKGYAKRFIEKLTEDEDLETVEGKLVRLAFK